MATLRPVFRIYDYDRAIEFYINWLGFKIDWEHSFGDNSPKYLQISLGNISLHLSEHHGDCSPGARAHIENFTGLKEYHSRLISADYKYNKPGIGKAFWDSNVTAMEVIDPFRNILSFSEPIPYNGL